MTAAATSTITARRSFLLRVTSGPVARELVGDPAAARASLQRPLERLFLGFVLRCGVEMLQPLADDLEIFVLVERIEAHPEPEALGERDLLLDRLAGVDLVADVLRLEV